MAISTTGYVNISNSDIDTVVDLSLGGVLPFKVGTEAADEDGNKYIFARGNTGITKGMLVVLDPAVHGGAFRVMNSAIDTSQTGVIANEDTTTARAGSELATNVATLGRVGIAMGYGSQTANTTSKYGWFKVYGEATIRSAASTANTAVYTSGTAGVATNAVVTANKVAGMKFNFTGAYLSATDGLGNVLHRAVLSYPFVG
jgi:hypothetical protein